MTDFESSWQENPQFLTQIYEQTTQVISELVEQGKIRAGQMLVIGCSTSEVVGSHIGKAGTKEVAQKIFAAIHSLSMEYAFHPVFQCCEHLNRALVMEQKCAEQYRYDGVHVIPSLKAGGALATFAYEQFVQPFVVEHVQAHGAIDIGNTLIGMHLKPVAVPFRPSIANIGFAHVTAAWTRPKLIGGARAIYSS